MVFVGPLMLKLLIKHVSDPTEEAWKGFLYVALIFINASVQSLLNHQFLQQTVISAQQIRAALSSMIFRKVCSLCRKLNVGSHTQVHSILFLRFCNLIFKNLFN